jgi:hypothetical protein
VEAAGETIGHLTEAANKRLVPSPKQRANDGHLTEAASETIGHLTEAASKTIGHLIQAASKTIGHLTLY